MVNHRCRQFTVEQSISNFSTRRKQEPRSFRDGIEISGSIQIPGETCFGLSWPGGEGQDD